MRTTCGGPGFASARWRWTATRPFPRPGPFALRAGQENVHSLRPVPPHRTRRLGHFPRRRKMSVPMRTTCGGPGFASARWRWTATRPFPRPGPFALRAGQENVHSLRPVPLHRTRHLGHFPRRRKVSVLGQTKDGSPWLPGRGQEDRASPQPGGGGQQHGLSRAPDRLLSARGKKTCTRCARSLCTARDISDIFHDEEKCPFWGKRRMALPGCRAGGRRTGLRLSPVVADSKPVPAALFAFAEGGAPGMPGEAGGCGRYPDIPAPG